MNNINYGKYNRTKLCYNISKSKNNENSCHLTYNSNLKREINEFSNLHFNHDGNEIKSKKKNATDELFHEYELNAEIIENFVGIDDKNIPYININYKNHINSKNILLIIDFFVCNLFFHLKNIGKNINNFYLSFSKIIYPFHFSFYNNICENCILKDNKNGIFKENNVMNFSELNKKYSEQVRNKKSMENSAHNFNEKYKNENDFLPNILKTWCERIKYTIRIYNSNKKNYKIKKYFLKDNETYCLKDKYICEKKSRYSINECLNTLKNIIFNNEKSNKFKNIYFFPKEKYFLTSNDTLKHNISKKKIKKSLKEKSYSSRNSCEETEINSVNSYLSEHHENYSKLYDDNITDLYIINYIKCKIEEYFKNVEVKKFWNIINVQYLTEFDYKYAHKKTNEKESSNSNKKYGESIYDYIQITKKDKYKKDIKYNEVTKVNKSIKKEIINNNHNFKKENLDGTFIFKDLFNNTIKSYNVNEVQINLSSYDNIFLKSLTRFYLLLNFSVELLCTLYEDVDLYSLHIFSLYEKLNEYIYNEQCEVGRQINERSNNENILKNTSRCNNIIHNASKRNKLYNQNSDTCYFNNSDKNNSTKFNTILKYNKVDNVNCCNHGNISNSDIINNPNINSTCNNNDTEYNNYKNYTESNIPTPITINFNDYSFSEKKLDTVVFYLLKLLLERQYDERTKDKNNIWNYLKFEKYKEILKEIKRLIMYTIKKDIHVKHVINYLLDIYNKYKDKLRELNCKNDATHSKYINILKNNFLLYSLNFYSFEFFSNKDLYTDLKKKQVLKNKKYIKWKLKIPGKISKKIIIQKFKTALRVFDFNKKLPEKIFNYECNSINQSNKTIVKIKINRKLFIKKKRKRYLRKLRYCVYSYFSSIHLCFDSHEKTDLIFENVGNIFHNLYKNFFSKTLNKIKIKEKILEIIKNKNTVYKKVVSKMKERNKIGEKNKLRNYEKYFNTFVGLLKIIKDQDRFILNNLFNMLNNINEQLNLFYTNICHCIPSQNSEKINVHTVMKQKIELLKEDINLNYPSETTLFHIDENSYYFDLKQKESNNVIKKQFSGNLLNTFFNKNNKQKMKQMYNEKYSYLIEANTKSDIHINNKTNEINGIQDDKNRSNKNNNSYNSNNLRIDNTDNNINDFHSNNNIKSDSNFTFDNIHNQNSTNYVCDYKFMTSENNNYILCNFNNNNKTLYEKKKYFNYNVLHNSNNKEYESCIKCNSMLDKNILVKKKKMFYNFFNLKKYYKEKRKKINYLAYDISILKEYFYSYLKKYFDDLIILFEYFFYYCNSYFCLDSNKVNNTFVSRSSENNSSDKNEELIYNIFALSNYDNFNNYSKDIPEYLNIKNNISVKDYNNYMFIKKLKFFVKNDIIQFINRNINLINNNVNLKIGNMKKAFNTIFRLLKVYNYNNEVLTFKILFSLILKYGKYCKKKIVKKNTLNKLSSNLNEYEIENDFLYNSKKKKFLEKFGIHYMGVSKDIVLLLKYIVLCNKDKEYTNEDILDRCTDNINTSNSLGNCIDNYFYNLSKYNEEDTLKNVLHKIIRKKKKMLGCENKIKKKITINKEEPYLDYLSNIYEIIYPNNLKSYENIKLFITVEKKRKTNRKRKLFCEDDLIENNFDSKNIKTKIKKIKKTVIKFIDDNKFVFPYIFNTFNFNLSAHLDYDIINLNNNFKFFHYLNKNEYSFKNSILNYIYGYPLLYIHKNDDINNPFLNNSNLENFLQNKKDEETKKNDNTNDYHHISNYNDKNKGKCTTTDDNNDIVQINFTNNNNYFKNYFTDLDTLNCKTSKIYKKIDNKNKENSNNAFRINSKKYINENSKTKVFSTNTCENMRNIENNTKIKKNYMKEFRKNKRKELINIFNNLNIFNNIPLKYIHLCVIADIFKYLNLHFILKDIFKKLYEEKLKEIQEKFDSNNKHYLPKVLICFIIYFYSFLDIIYGIRDGNFINMSNNGNYNIFNNFNNMVLKKKKKKEDNHSANEIQRKSYIYMNNRFSKKNNYLWILKKKEKNDLSSYVDKIYLTLKKKKKSDQNKFYSNFSTFLKYYLDYNFSFLNNTKNICENKSKNYLFVYNNNDKIYENSDGNAKELLDTNNNDTLLYKYLGINIHNMKENANYKKSPLYLSRINFSYFSQYHEKSFTFLKKYELIEKEDEEEITYNFNDSTNLLQRLEFFHDLLRKYLKEILEKKKYCIIDALSNFKICKKGLEDIRFTHHLIYLLNYGNKQNNSDFILYKNLYYLLIEKLYNEKLNKDIDSEQMVYFILNLIKMTRIIKVKSNKIEKLFELLQKYAEKFSDFHFNVFNKFFLFIYEDVKIENKIFLKSYFNKYFNDTKIILHIFNHILNSPKYRKNLLFQKDKNEELEDLCDLNNKKVLSSNIQKEVILNDQKGNKDKNCYLNNNNQNSNNNCNYNKIDKHENPFSLNNFFRLNNERRETNLKKERFSNINQEIIKKVFLKYKSMYSSDSSSNENRVFKIKNIRNINYIRYEKEKAKYISHKMNKNKIINKYKGNKKLYSNINRIKERNNHIFINKKNHNSIYNNFMNNDHNNKNHNINNNSCAYYENENENSTNSTYYKYNKRKEKKFPSNFLNNEIENNNSVNEANIHCSSDVINENEKMEITNKKKRYSLNIKKCKKHIEDYSSDEFYDFVNIYMYYEKNTKKNNVYINNIYYDDNSSICSYNSNALNNNGSNEEESKKKMFFYLNELNNQRFDKLLSLVSNGDINNFKKDKDDNYNEKENEYDHLQDTQSEGADNNSDRKNYHKFINFNCDNSFCFIKYKPYLEFNNKSTIKKKKQKEKEKKRKNKPVVMYVPLYISIVGGLDIFLHKFNNYISDMYVNPYFYINTFYFQKYIRKQYEINKYYDNYLIYDYYYYNYIFCNKFNSYYSYKVIKDKRIRADTYIKFFKYNIDTVLNEKSGSNKKENVVLNKNEKIKNTHVSLNENILPEKYNSKENVKDNKYNNEKINSKTYDEVIMKKEKESTTNENIKRKEIVKKNHTNMEQNPQNNICKSYDMEIHNYEKKTNDENNKNFINVTNLKKEFDNLNAYTNNGNFISEEYEENFFYTDNNLSSDDDEYRRSKKDINEIYLLKRDLFIINYLHNYFNFSVLIRMKNMIEDMFHNYNLNLPYINKYIKIKETKETWPCEGNIKNKINIKENEILINEKEHVNMNPVYSNNSIFLEKENFKKFTKNVIHEVEDKKKNKNRIHEENELELYDENFNLSKKDSSKNIFYNSLMKEQFISKKIQISITVLNLEYWKFENLKEDDEIVRNLMSDSVQTYFDSINDIYQKKNGDKYLLFIYDLCYIDLSINDFIYTLKLSEGLLFLFLSNLENHTIDIYKNNLLYNDMKTNSNIYNYEYMFISSNYKHTDNKTIHIIVNDNIILYDFHIIKNSQNLINVKKKKHIKKELHEEEPIRKEEKKDNNNVNNCNNKLILPNKKDSNNMVLNYETKTGEKNVEKKEGINSIKIEEQYHINFAYVDVNNETKNSTQSMEVVNKHNLLNVQDIKLKKNEYLNEPIKKEKSVHDNKSNNDSSNMNQDGMNPLNKQISKENFYYKLNFLKEVEEKEIEKISNNRNIDGIYVRLFFTEEYLIQKTNISEKFMKETLKKLTRKKFLQKSTLKIMNKTNNKTTQFSVYSISDFDNLDDNKNKKEEVEKSLPNVKLENYVENKISISSSKSSADEPVDYFLDNVVTESDEEKEIKRRRTFDNLNLDESYEFYEKEILRITMERMNKMKSEPGKNTSTPLFLILNSLNKTLAEKNLKKVTQQNILAILNIMLKNNKITRIGGNWQPI